MCVAPRSVLQLHSGFLVVYRHQRIVPNDLVRLDVNIFLVVATPANANLFTNDQDINTKMRAVEVVESEKLIVKIPQDAPVTHDTNLTLVRLLNLKNLIIGYLQYTSPDRKR